MGNKAKMYVDIMALHQEVTGSCFLCVLRLPNDEKLKFVVDCGLFQEDGYDEYNYSFPFEAENIDFALLTHNHVDHTGRLPFLYRNGFSGKIFCTEQTKILLPLALSDSCKVLKDVCKRQNRKQLYSESDVDRAIKNTVGVAFNETISVNPNVNVTFLKNGHLIGAASILIEIHYDNHESINIMFSGDYNGKNEFFEVDEIPENIKDKRLSLILESTYGIMNSSDIVYEFDKNLLNSIEEDKTIIIPVFSLGRAQEILLKLKKLQNQNKLDVNIPIFFDGNLAHCYTNLYLKNDAILSYEKRDFLPENLTFVDCNIREQLLSVGNCKIIVTTSGMGTYGPAQVYLPYFISKTNATIIFTGYTAEGTMGRTLQETPKGEFVKLGGLIAKKNANVYSSTEFSAHAKANELIEFANKFSKLRAVIINHGNEDSKEKMAERIIEEVNPSQVGIINRDYFFRIDTWGINKTLSTKFK